MKDKYTLIKNDEIVLENVSLQKIGKHIEKLEKSNFFDTLNKVFVPLFEKYSDVKYLKLVQWGTFYKYECSGETYIFDEIIEHQDHLDADHPILDDLEESWELYNKAFSKKNLISVYEDFPEAGGLQLIATWNGKEIEYTTNDYDPE